MSTAKFNQWLNSDGTENYKCRAWVNFNGTGTVAIRASGNVTSITDNGVGAYTVNFTTAMPDANYTVVGTANQVVAVNRCFVISGSLSTARTASAAFMIVADAGTNAGIDNSEVCLSIFR